MLAAVAFALTTRTWACSRAAWPDAAQSLSWRSYFCWCADGRPDASDESAAAAALVDWTGSASSETASCTGGGSASSEAMPVPPALGRHARVQTDLRSRTTRGSRFRSVRRQNLSTRLQRRAASRALGCTPAGTTHGTFGSRLRQALCALARSPRRRPLPESRRRETPRRRASRAH